MSKSSRRVFPVTEMDCPSCVQTIIKELGKVDGVDDVKVNFLMKRVYVDYDPDKVGVPEIEKKLEDLGYRLSHKEYRGLFERLLLGKEFELRPVLDHEFDVVLRANKPVVLVFTSPFCPSCRALRQRLKSSTEKFGGSVYFFEMDIGKTKRWSDYEVMSVPSTIFIVDGKEVGRLTSLPESHEIEEKIEKLFRIQER